LVVAGDTREEVVALAREFAWDYLADFDQKGQPWPDPFPRLPWRMLKSIRRKSHG